MLQRQNKFATTKIVLLVATGPQTRWHKFVTVNFDEFWGLISEVVVVVVTEFHWNGPRLNVFAGGSVWNGVACLRLRRCTIHWKKGQNVTVKTIKKVQKHRGRGTKRTVTKTVQNDSFFNFFTPPTGTCGGWGGVWSFSAESGWWIEVFAVVELLWRDVEKTTDGWRGRELRNLQLTSCCWFEGKATIETRHIRNVKKNDWAVLKYYCLKVEMRNSTVNRLVFVLKEQRLLQTVVTKSLSSVL